MRKVSEGKQKPKLQDVSPSVLPAAWLILRWYIFGTDCQGVAYTCISRCVASCTAYLEEITNKEELVRGLGVFNIFIAPVVELTFVGTQMRRGVNFGSMSGLLMLKPSFNTRLNRLSGRTRERKSFLFFM